MKRLWNFFCVTVIVFSFSCVARGELLHVERAIELPDGKPAAGVKVLLRSLNSKDGTLKDEKRVVTDQEGIARGEIEIDSSDNMSPIRTTGYMVVDAPGMALVFEDFNNWFHWAPSSVRPVRLNAGKDITGKVINKSGGSIGGATISLLGFDTQWVTWRVNFPSAGIVTPEASTQSKDDGSFTMRAMLIANRSAELSGGVPIFSARVVKDGETLIGTQQYYVSGKADFSLRVAPTATLRGAIVNTLDNKPVKGAKIELRAFPDTEIAATIAPALTQDDGTFAIQDVGPQRKVFVVVTHPDFGINWKIVDKAQDRSEPKTDKPSHFEDVNIALRPLANVQGKVVDVLSKTPPQTPTTIMAIYEEGFNDGNIKLGRGALSTRMKPDGSFSMRMPVGANHIRVRGVGYWEGGYAHPIDLDIRPGDNLDQIFEVRREKGFMAHFSTSAAKGKPDYNFDREYDLLMRGADGKEKGTNWGEWWMWPLYKPDDTLEVRFTRFVDGFAQEVLPWTKLTANRDDAPADAANWPREIRLPLRQSLSVKGRVLSAATGKPLVRATVKLFSRPEIAVKNIAPVTSDANGDFAFENVPLPAELMVSAIPLRDGKPAADYVEGYTRVGTGELAAVATSADEGHQEFKDIVVRPARLVTLSGRVLDARTDAPATQENSADRISAVPVTDFATLPSSGDTPNYKKPLRKPWKAPLYSPIAPDGSFSFQAPAGPVTLALGNYFQPDIKTFTIPEAGLSDFVVKAERSPVLMLRFIREDASERRGLKMEVLTGIRATEYIGFEKDITVRTWMVPVKEWGMKFKVKLSQNPGGAEVFSGEVVNDPKNWPIEIRIPAQ